MKVKQIAYFLLRTVVVIVVVFALNLLLSLLFRTNIGNVMFLTGILIIGIVLFTFLDETTLISSSPCGKNFAMSKDMHKYTASQEIERRKKRHINFTKLRWGILMVTKPSRLSIFICGITLIFTCFVLG